MISTRLARAGALVSSQPCILGLAVGDVCSALLASKLPPEAKIA